VGFARAAAVTPEEPYARTRRFFEEEIIEMLGSMQTWGMRLSGLEALLSEQMKELMRQLLQEHLARMGPGRVEGGVTGSDGVDRREPRVHERHVETVFGTVKLSRMGYGAEGEQSHHPRDAELNLAEELFSHLVRRRVAEEASRGSFDEAIEAIEKTTGAKLGKRQGEELAARAAEDFDAFYQARQQQTPPVERTAPDVLVLTTDGKGVVMRRQDLREATRQAAENRRHKMGSRLSKGEKLHAKRMATVAAVYSIAPHVRTPEEILAPKGPLRQVVDARRPRPEGKRVWASLEKTPEAVIDEMFAEGRMRDPDGKATWAALVDGAKPQLKLLKNRAKAHGVKLTIVLDFVHVTEYVWKAGLAFQAEGSPELEIWVRDRLLEILHGKGRRVAAALTRDATKANMTETTRHAVDKCADYLTAYAKHQRYDDFLLQGLPIATGVIEGACRHLVKDRMDVTGARWSLRGAEAILRLRALRTSGDFEEYWVFHEQCEWERNHASRYAGGKPPKPIDESRPSSRHSLKLVK